jgi:hypothetical protein
MQTLNLASKAVAGRLLGSRHFALAIRDELETMLRDGDQVEIDFANTNPTQSFIDELVGVLVLERGKPVLSHLVLKNCSPKVKAILHLVVGDRLRQLEAHEHHYA